MLNQYLVKIAFLLEQFIDWTGRLVSWLVISMVLVTFLVVVMRYMFDSGLIALQESISYMHSIVFLVGAAYTLKHDGHVRVDIFYARMSESAKAWVELIGHVFMLIPVMLFIIWISYPYVESAWKINESSPEAGGLPGVFLLKSLILVMAGLLVLQAISLIFQAILKIAAKHKPDSKLKDNSSGAAS